jgi:protein-L-isoaspartate(D-aspartate) O-methyltransferase
MTSQTEAHRLDDAFAAVPRAVFLPDDQVRFADVNRALPIGHGQTNSQPSTVRDMLALLDVRPGQRVLDVGCGSGWTTALLARLVGAGGTVHGVEIVPELVETGRSNLARLPGAGERGAATISQARRGVLGLPAAAPYDRVLVSADAPSLPEELVEQLRVGGVLVAPVAGELVRVRREDAGVDVTRAGAYSFVPLVDQPPG